MLRSHFQTLCELTVQPMTMRSNALNAPRLLVATAPGDQGEPQLQSATRSLDGDKAEAAGLLKLESLCQG